MWADIFSSIGLVLDIVGVCMISRAFLARRLVSPRPYPPPIYRGQFPFIDETPQQEYLYANAMAKREKEIQTREFEKQQIEHDRLVAEKRWGLWGFCFVILGFLLQILGGWWPRIFSCIA